MMADFFFSYRAGASVAWMERSAIGVFVRYGQIPHFASLHAGYGLARVSLLPWREKVASPR
jgi:hypothetical protein